MPPKTNSYARWKKQELMARGIQAARAGHVLMVRDLILNHNITRRSLLAYEMYLIAVSSGYIDVVREFILAGVRISGDAVNYAAENGHLNIIRELRDVCNVHCSVDGACAAAGNGHLEVVKDLHAHGVHMDSRVAKAAMLKKQGHVVEYLKSHGIISLNV